MGGRYYTLINVLIYIGKVDQAYNTASNFVDNIGSSVKNVSGSLGSIAWALGLAVVGSVVAYEVINGNSEKRSAVSAAHWGSLNLENCHVCKKIKTTY